MAAAAIARLFLSTTDDRSAVAVFYVHTTRDLYQTVTERIMLSDEDLHHEVRLPY
jgi:hypothetical protein